MHDKRVATANIFQNSDEDVAFAENLSLAGGESYAEAVGDFLSEHGVAGTSQNGQIALRRLKRLKSRPLTAVGGGSSLSHGDVVRRILRFRSVCAGRPPIVIEFKAAVLKFEARSYRRQE